MMRLERIRVLLLRIVFVPMLFVVLFVGHPWKDGSLWDFVFGWVGYVMILTGLGIRGWATLYIGSRKSKELITQGPFSICRNPLYVGSLILAAGVSLCLENLVLLVVILAVVVPVHWLVVLSEERRLAEIFGEPYEQYKRQVPRFGLAFKNFHTQPVIEVSVRSIYRATSEAMLALLVPVGADLINVLHASGRLPVWWTY